MINYSVDENKKATTCILDGEEVYNSCSRKVEAMLNNIPKNMIQIDQDMLTLSDGYVGVAKYADDEEIPFSTKQGQIIARKKAFAKYNVAMRNKMRKLYKNLTQLQESVLFAMLEYDYKAKDIEKKLK